MLLLYTNDCISAPNLNIFTTLSALESLDYDLFSRILHLFLQKEITFFLRLIEKKTPTMGNLVVVGLGELQTLFGTYEQFVGCLWNVFW